MYNEPETWSLDQLANARLGRTVLLATPSVSERATKSLSFELVEDLDHVPEDLDTLIVIGGGTLLDEAKVWRVHHAPEMRLIAIPSLWGSGAEVSPVAVLNRQGKKEILIGDELILDIRSIVLYLLCRQIPVAELLDILAKNTALASEEGIDVFLSFVFEVMQQALCQPFFSKL